MHKERVCANKELRPVTPYENESVKGQALCGEDVLAAQMDRVKDLRGRHSAYLNSLPSDHAGANLAALRILHHDSESYPEGFEEALNLSICLEAALKDLEDDGHLHQALSYTADRISFALHRAAKQLDRISDVLSNPTRVGREGEAMV